MASSYGAHQSTPIASSAATLTKPLGLSALKYPEDYDPDAEEWEIVPVLDTPKWTLTARLPSPGQAMGGRPVDSDRASVLSIELSYPRRRQQNQVYFLTRGHIRARLCLLPHHRVHSALLRTCLCKCQNSLDVLDMRFANPENMNSRARRRQRLFTRPVQLPRLESSSSLHVKSRWHFARQPRCSLANWHRRRVPAFGRTSYSLKYFPRSIPGSVAGCWPWSTF